MKKTSIMEIKRLKEGAKVVPNFSITNKMLNLIVEITQKVTRLELEKERNLHLRKENRIRSIHSSLAIEANSLSLEQVTDIIDGKRVLGAPKEIREVQNAYEAYEKVFDLNPYSIEDFLTAHRLITRDLVKESGHLRNGDVGVYDSEGNIVHIGARPQFIYQLVQELFSWAEIENIPDLIKSCVIHFEIEMIHPFADGNGRMGRLWQNLILSRWQQVFEWIPIETIVYENQMEYYNMLMIGDRENDATMFIEFMLEVILKTIKDFENIDASNPLSFGIEEQLNAKERAFFNQISPYLLENSEIWNAKAVELSGKSVATVRRYLFKLVNLGILEATGENRNRRYFLKDNMSAK